MKHVIMKNLLFGIVYSFFCWNINAQCKGPGTLVICSSIYEPVCGCDGITYSNACQAGNAGTLSYTEGECPLLEVSGSGRSKFGTEYIEDLGSNNLGLSGDIVPHGTSELAYDLGNNNSTEHWDDVVAKAFITYSSSVTSSSFKSMNNTLNDLLKVKPVSFDDHKKNNLSSYGLNPKELIKIFPSVVVQEDIDFDQNGNMMVTRNGELGINYSALIPIIIKAIQEQNQLIIKTQKQNKELFEQIEHLQHRLNESLTSVRLLNGKSDN